MHPTAGAQRRRILPRLLLLLVASGFSIALGEAAVRGLARLSGEPFRADMVRAELCVLAADLELGGEPSPRVKEPDNEQEAKGSANPFKTHAPHPFYAWETSHGFDLLNQALSAAELDTSPDSFTIMIVGGSVAGLFGDGEKTGGALEMVRLLEATPAFAGRKLRIIGQGHGAFKQPQQGFLVTHLLSLGLEPDAILNLDGFNEVAIACQNLGLEAHPLYPSWPQWSSVSSGITRGADLAALHEYLDSRFDLRDWARQVLDRELYRSALLALWIRVELNTKLARKQAGREAFLENNRSGAGKELTVQRGPPFKGGPQQAVEAAVASWKESSLELAAICKRRGIQYIHVLQPTLYDPGAKAKSEEEAKINNNQLWRQGVRLGYPLLRETGAELARAGVPFLDASMVFADVQETLYYDPCHFNRVGNALLARAIAAAIESGAHPR